MDFDFELIGVPFRMQPGLRRLPAGARQLTPLAPGSPLREEKRQVRDAGGARHCVAGFDEGPVLQAIAARAAQEGAPPFDARDLELAFEEDFALLDGATGTLPWLCVCVPSHWAPEDKLGLDFAAVHAPVADNARLQAAGRHLVELATGGECWERHVWTVSPSERYDQHPKRHPREPWPPADAPDYGARCWLRVERQTFFPVPGARQAVFTIRVMLQRLDEATRDPARARRLHDAIASMTPEVLRYKGLAPARAPLLAWLQARSG